VKDHQVKRAILVIDDDRIFGESIRDEFSSEEVEVLLGHTGEEGLHMCSRRKIDVVLLDQKLPDVEGHTLCQPILKTNEQAKIIFITAFPSFDHAVKALKAGAHDYLSKPMELAELRLSIEHAFQVQGLERVRQFHHYRDRKEREENVLIGNFGGRTDIKHLIELAASVDSPVLITGETGTGKNIVAKAIHYRGGGRDETAPFFAVNCAALPENLVEAELFGYEKGAFTGAVSARKGVFEIAEGGSLFLDEIGSMPLHLQVKLLGVLDEGKIKRLGGQSMVAVNTRVIAATNTDLERAVEQGRFRQDLYYRLGVLRIHLPPLRERREDIPELSDFFIKKFAGERQVELPAAERQALMDYHWPGNVRELKNIIERSLILHRHDLRPGQLLGEIGGAPTAPLTVEEAPLKTLEEVERQHIRHMLQAFSGNLTRSARALGISLSTLKRKVKEYGLRRTGSK
jgi:DNA-binding NtrC family response regulator